ITLVAVVCHFLTPVFTLLAYAPNQPVPFINKDHAGNLDIHCQYCHTDVFNSEYPNIPATQTCMNCHSQIKTDSPRLEPVRESWETGEPIEWINVHLLPDYVQFSHEAHVNVGVGCESCHGRIDKVKVVQ